MDFNRLFYFSEIARLQSFTLAAQKLRISQPALSKAMKLLEDELGTSLLIRNRNGVKLTEPGKILLADTDRILRTVHGLKGRLSSDAALFSGVVQIGASDNFSNHLLPDLWTQFSAKFPLADLRVLSGTSTQLYPELLNRKVDFTICFHESENSKVKNEKFGEIEFAPVLASHLKASEIGNLPFIGSISEDYSMPYMAVKILKKIGIEPKRQIQANQQEVQKNLVMQGLGYSVLPKFMIADELKRGELKFIPTAFTPKAPIYFGVLQNRKLSPLATNFKALIKESFS